MRSEPTAKPSGVLLRPALLLCARVGAVYLPSLWAPFIYDDYGAVVDDASIRLVPLGPALRPPPDTPVSGRALLNLSFA